MVFQCDVVNPPLTFPIYGLIYEIMYSLYKPGHDFSREFLTMEWSLMDRDFFPLSCETYWMERWFFDNLFFTEQNKPLGNGSDHALAHELRPQ